MGEGTKSNCKTPPGPQHLRMHVPDYYHYGGGSLTSCPGHARRKSKLPGVGLTRCSTEQFRRAKPLASCGARFEWMVYAAMTRQGALSAVRAAVEAAAFISAGTLLFPFL